MNTNAAYGSRYRMRRTLLTVAGVLGGAAGGFAFLIAAIRRWFG